MNIYWFWAFLICGLYLLNAILHHLITLQNKRVDLLKEEINDLRSEIRIKELEIKQYSFDLIIKTLKNNGN